MSLCHCVKTAFYIAGTQNSFTPQAIHASDTDPLRWYRFLWRFLSGRDFGFADSNFLN